MNKKSHFLIIIFFVTFRTNLPFPFFTKKRLLNITESQMLINARFHLLFIKKELKLFDSLNKKSSLLYAQTELNW